MSDVAQALTANGIDLPTTHPDRRALQLAILRAEADAYRAVKARRQGAILPTPMRPANILIPEPEPEPAAPTLSELREVWIRLKQPSERAIADNKLYVGRFIDLFGDIPITQVTKKMVRAFRDTLLDCPRNVPKGRSRSSDRPRKRRHG